MTKKYQQLLLTSLIVAMILPFSSMPGSYAEISFFEKAKPFLDEIERLTTTVPLPVNDSSSSSGSAAKSIGGEYIVNATRLQELRAELVTLSKEQRELHAITPTRLAELREAQEILSDSPIPFIGLGVNHDKELVSLEIHEKYVDLKPFLKYAIKLYIDEPFELIFTLPMILDSCPYQTSDCDPIIGGIKMHTTYGGDCTIGLPVKMVQRRGDIEGFITAAHCVTLNEIVHQPSSVFTQDGKVIKLSADCDCAFVKNTGSAKISSATWQLRGVNTITAKMDPLKFDYVMMVGQKSGTKIGQVVETNLTRDINGVEVDNVMKIKYFESQNGDSGAPIISLNYGGVFHGTVSGHDRAHYTYAVQWSTIDRELDLR